MRKKLSHPNKGFTLVELMVVIAIVAILSTIGLTIYSNAQEGARVAFTRETLSRLRDVVLAYEAKNGILPPDRPPDGSMCGDPCINDNETRADWMRDNLLATLIAVSDGGPYIDSVEKFVYDGWRSAITYDVACSEYDPTPLPGCAGVDPIPILCSYGPNKQWNGGAGPEALGSDDICFIANYGN